MKVGAFLGTSQSYIVYLVYCSFGRASCTLSKQMAGERSENHLVWLPGVLFVWTCFVYIVWADGGRKDWEPSNILGDGAENDLVTSWAYYSNNILPQWERKLAEEALWHRIQFPPALRSCHCFCTYPLLW